MTDVKAGTGTPQLDSFAGVKYDFGNARSFSVRQNFSFVSPGSGATATTSAQDTRSNGEFHIGDIALNYADGKLATILGDGALILIARQYLPTGEASRFFTKQAGQTRLYLIESKSFGKWDLSLVQAGRYYENTQDSFFNISGKETQNRESIASVEFDAFYNLNSVVSMGFIAGYDRMTLRPLADKDTRAEDFYIQPTLQVVPARGVVAQLYLYDELNTRTPERDHALLREEETSVWANLALTL